MSFKGRTRRVSPGYGCHERMRFAAATAAMKATKPGGQAGIPDWATAMAFLRER